MPPALKLNLVQSLPTSGARAAAVFQLQGRQYLAVPQLARDIPGGEAGMNLGDSDVPLNLYRANTDGVFESFQELPVPGGEDAEFFSIEGRHFLATASLRSGRGPYNMDVKSTIFEWDGHRFVEFQQIPTFAVKQWRYFTLDGRHFLALAQGVDVPGLVSMIPADSAIFVWDGSQFTLFQTVPSKWGYNWLHFSLDEQQFLAYADQVSPSILLKWNGQAFVQFQQFDGTHGRAFSFFKSKNGTPFLAFSRIFSDSLLYRWDGAKFQVHQSLEGEGGREFALVDVEGSSYLVHVKFITGTPHDPQPALDSVIYSVENDGLSVVSTFPTLGGTDVSIISSDGPPRIVVTESLTAAKRFRTDTHIYQLVLDRPAVGNSPAGGPYQCPEFLSLFTEYTASSTSIGAKLTTTVTNTTSSYPLLVATSFDILLFPGSGQDPSYINFRLGNRGFKELAAISHLGPALASLVKIYETDKTSDAWIPYAHRLLNSVQDVERVNSLSLWRDYIQVQAFQGREHTIAEMVNYACQVTRGYLELVLKDPGKLTAEFLRDQYLEATGDEIGATVPFNAVMIATFFLVGLDTSYRMRKWFEQYDLDWKNAMVLVTGKQGRDTSGVTIGTSSVAQMILQTLNLELPIERLYIAPHGPVPVIKDATDMDSLRKYEQTFRLAWNALHGMGQLGETMFAPYPAYTPEQNSRPIIDSSTRLVSELPRITKPDDWFSMNTRMRLVLEDSRQLLSGCVTDYAAEQLRLAQADLSKVVVPGLDGVDYSVKTHLYAPPRILPTMKIASCPYPLRVDLPAPTKTLKVNQGHLAYRTSGPLTAKPIIWIHGLPLDSRSWTAQYDYFSQDFYNVFIDLRGYGASGKLPPGTTDVTQLYCNDLLALMEHLNLLSAHIVGFASAGHVALRFSAQHPSRILNLVVLNGSPRFKRNSTDYPFGFSNDQINNHFLAAARTRGIEGLADQVLDPAVVFQDLSADDAATISAWFREMAYNAGLDTLLGFFEHMVNDDDRHLVPLIKAPTLILSSSRGKEVPAQTALFLRSNIATSRLVEIPDADHFFHVTRPVVVNELIGGFLSTE